MGQGWYDLEMDFGAKKDNTINDLQLFFNSLQDEDTVFIPRGVFTLKPFSLKNKRNIRFEGNGTLKRSVLTSGNFISIDGCEGITLGINIDNSDMNNAAIYMKDCANFSFKKTKIKNLYSKDAINVYAVQITRGCSFGKFEDCEFENIRCQNESKASARAIFISNYNVTENHTIGIEVDNCKFINMISGSDTDAIVIDQLNFYGYHRIARNHFIDIVKRPIKLLGHGNIVKENRIFHSGMIGTSFAGFSSYGNDNLIEGNEIYGIGKNGIWANFVDCKGATTIRRNKFYNSDLADTSLTNGIYVYDNNNGIYNIEVEGNEFRNIRHGLYLNIGTPVDNLKINNNKFSGTLSKHIIYLRSLVTKLEINQNSSTTSPQFFLTYDINPILITMNDNNINASWGIVSPTTHSNLNANRNINNGIVF
ncbi:hypothetical protein [Peribacillus sp. NPDC096448]|uniref:hypothetical protein n=1 Tax=Peribacillus sp. NPDC096448 TaxID=3364395 RepID=UPI0037F780EC